MTQRETAWCLLTEFTQSESLRKHALAVEACMRAYARKAGADEELWGMTGLLHDFDYEKYPTAEDHPFEGNDILKERGYSEEVRRAIMSHARVHRRGAPVADGKDPVCLRRTGRLHHRVCAGEAGKSLAEVEAKSVRKKMKDKAFARSVNRDDITVGAAELGVELEEHIGFCIAAMKGIAAELGLDGSTARTA